MTKEVNLKLKMVNLNTLLNNSSYIKNLENTKKIENIKDGDIIKKKLLKYYLKKSKSSNKITKNDNKSQNINTNYTSENILLFPNEKSLKNKSKSEIKKIKKNNNISFSFNNKINKIKIKNKYRSISLENPLKNKIKTFIKKNNNKYTEINTYPFNFNNLKLFNISKDKEINKEKKKTKKNILIKSKFKKEIPIKYYFPKIEDELINIYKKINCEINPNDIIENSKINTKISKNSEKNIKICTNYISKNINDLIKKRILKKKKNKSEEKKDNNYFYTNTNPEEEIKFNILVLDNTRNQKLNSYNSLNSYSIYQILNQNDFKNRNNSFKKFHIYNKKYKDTNIKTKRHSYFEPINIKRKHSLEGLIKEKSQNIFFEYYSYFGETPNEISKKNENELKSYLNLIYLTSKLKNKINELNYTKKISNYKIESNEKEIKLKTYELIENINAMTNLSNNLTNDIILHKCQKDFTQIKLRNAYNEVNELKDKFEKNSSSANDNQKEGIKLKETYKKKIVDLNKEIENIRYKIKKNREAGINYYLNILKDGIDNRNIGLSWIVKRLLRLNYTPNINDFPDYVDNIMYNYFMRIAKNKNIILDCLQELGEIKNDIFEEKNNKDEYKIIKPILRYSLTENNILEKKKIKLNLNKNEEKLKEKLKKLLEQYSFWTISPEMKLRIESFCSNNISKKIEKNKFLINNQNNEINFDKSTKGILIIINKVFNLKNIIQNSYIEIDNLKKEIIKYIKKLLNNENIYENNSFLEKNLRKDSIKIKIIRNLIGNENKLKDITKMII